MRSKFRFLIIASCILASLNSCITNQIIDSAFHDFVPEKVDQINEYGYTSDNNLIIEFKGSVGKKFKSTDNTLRIPLDSLLKVYHSKETPFVSAQINQVNYKMYLLDEDYDSLSLPTFVVEVGKRWYEQNPVNIQNKLLEKPFYLKNITGQNNYVYTTSEFKDETDPIILLLNSEKILPRFEEEITKMAIVLEPTKKRMYYLLAFLPVSIVLDVFGYAIGGALGINPSD